MQKLSKLVLMLCLTLSGAMCYAYGAARTGDEKGEGPILTKLKAQHGGTDKSGSIVSYIDGHTLTVIFTENIGLVEMEITTDTGVHVQTYWANTPDGQQAYIPQTGDYVITFTLSNGDEYYGEFTVTD